MRLFFLLACCSAFNLHAQTLSGISSRWSDSFVEWDIFVFAPPDTTAGEAEEEAPGSPEEEVFGELKLRWLNVKDDWTEWDYTFGDLQGTIRLKWKNDPSQWELRTYTGDVVTMRVAWANDNTEWRITDNSNTLNWRSRWTSQFDQWQLNDSRHGAFNMYSLRSNDPRDWAIEDGLDNNISTPMKIAMVFITVFYSSPRE